MDVALRVRGVQQQMNRRAPDAWERYGAHRERLMRLVPETQGGRLCVFGAGNCDDIELEQLAATFQQVHLVDLDREALERARDRQPESVRSRLVLHGDVDLSGFLSRLDEWGDAFPSQAELGRAAVAAAVAIVRTLGEAFDVTLSTCILSQLKNPFRRCWALSPKAWTDLEAALTGVHLTTLAGATCSGGRGFIAFDVLSSEKAPLLLGLAGRSTRELQAIAEDELEASAMRPNPHELLRQLQSPGLGSLFASPRLTAPWLWDIESGRHLVYGLAFTRP